METETNKRQREALYDWVHMLVCSVVAAVLLFTFGIRLILVDGESMRETLQHQDTLLVINDWLCGNYEAGEIVILAKPTFEDGAPIVKRVIATAGQTVDIDFEIGAVYVDGKELHEDYIRELTLTPEGVEFPITLEEDEIFVLGDNRNESSDSRHPDLGPIDTRYVLGRAVFLLVPGKSADLDKREWNRIGLV